MGCTPQVESPLSLSHRVRTLITSDVTIETVIVNLAIEESKLQLIGFPNNQINDNW